MPKKPASLHPLLWRAVEETVGTWGQPGSIGAEGEAKRLILRYWTLRQGRTGLPVLGGCLGGFALFVAGLILMGATTWPFALGCWLGALIALAWMTGRLLWFRFASIEEVATVLPVLALTRTQRSAFEAWLALEASALPEETKSELRAGLDRLVDEEARLDALSARGLGAAARPAAIEAERDGLRERLEGTADPLAREALEHGLRTCERRLEAARGASAATERIDAQREMIAQAADDVRDGLLRLGTAPALGAEGVEASSVREALAHVQAHAAALEAAVAEVRGLDGRG